MPACVQRLNGHMLVAAHVSRAVEGWRLAARRKPREPTLAEAEIINLFGAQGSLQALDKVLDFAVLWFQL